MAKWQEEKSHVDKINKLKGEIDKPNHEIEMAQRNYDLDLAAKLNTENFLNLKRN